MNLAVIQNKIHEINGIKIMLDFDLAELYEVETRVLNQAIKRNIESFPALRKTLLNIDSIQSHIQELETKYDKQFEDIFEAIQFLITDHEQTESKAERVKIGYKK